jgi:hypothetical protein
MRDRAILYPDDHTGTGGMNRCAYQALGGSDHLPLEYLITGRYQRLGDLSDVLLQRQYQEFGKQGLTHRPAGGLGLVVWQVKSPVKPVEAASGPVGAWVMHPGFAP